MTGPELVAARQRMGLTQDALAFRLGVHADTVSRWERGTRKISKPMATLVKYMESIWPSIKDMHDNERPTDGGEA